MEKPAAGTIEPAAQGSGAPDPHTDGRGRGALVVVAIIVVAIVLQVAWVALLGMLLVTSLRAVGI